MAVFTTDHLEYCQLFHLAPQNSIFQAEAQAILEAINWALTNNFPKITIVSDSSSVLQAIQASNQRDPLIIQIQETLINLRAEKKKYFLQWTKAHVGNIGNETADQLAKQAAKDPSLPLTTIKLPISHIKRILQKEALVKWQLEWDCATTGRYTHTYFEKVKQKRLVSTPWHTTLLTNHGPFPSYLERFHLASSSYCACGSPGTAQHYLHNCLLTQEWHIPPPQAIHTWLARLYYHKPTAKKIRELYYWLTSNSALLVDTL